MVGLYLIRFTILLGLLCGVTTCDDGILYSAVSQDSALYF